MIVNWMKLERALESYAVGLRRRFGITGLQLAILRILSERPEHALAALRKSLVLHPATLGQAIDELRVLGLCTVRTNPADRRARVVAITDKGTGIVREALAVACAVERYGPRAGSWSSVNAGSFRFQCHGNRHGRAAPGKTARRRRQQRGLADRGQ